MPADEEGHDVAAVAEQARVAVRDADCGESDEEHRYGEPREEVARLHGAAERRRERLLGEAPVEDLIGGREVRMIDEMRDEQHRGRNRRAVFGVGQDEHQRKQEERAPAQAKEIDHRSEEEALVAGALFSRSGRDRGVGVVGHGQVSGKSSNCAELSSIARDQ